MRILVVCSEFFNSSNGLCLSTQRFVKELIDLGQEVRILASENGGTPDYPVPVMRLPFVNGIMDKQNFHFAKPDSDVINEALDWADLVHVEDPFPLSVKVAKEATRRGLPITGTFHLYPENMTASVPIFDFYFSNHAIMKVFRWGVFQYCYAIQCPTDKVRLRLQHSRFESKLFVISNGIPADYIADNPCEEKNDLFTILSVGRYSNEKDQKTLIKAVKLSKYADKIQLILAGKGPLEKKYRRLGKKLPHPPILGFYTQEELREKIRKADLYVHCANVEIEGMGCMEAFAQGTVPIIADSKLSSTSSYALTSQNEYHAGRVKELVQKIDYWFEHRDELYSVGKDYIKFARTLTVHESAKKVLKMMKEALEVNKSKRRR